MGETDKHIVSANGNCYVNKNIAKGIKSDGCAILYTVVGKGFS